MLWQDMLWQNMAKVEGQNRILISTATTVSVTDYRLKISVLSLAVREVHTVEVPCLESDCTATRLVGPPRGIGEWRIPTELVQSPRTYRERHVQTYHRAQAA